MFIEQAKILFNPWIAGVLLSAILAAVMSTLSCQLLVCSSALTKEFCKAFSPKGASQRELVYGPRYGQRGPFFYRRPGACAMLRGCFLPCAGRP